VAQYISLPRHKRGSLLPERGLVGDGVRLLLEQGLQLVDLGDVDELPPPLVDAGGVRGRPGGDPDEPCDRRVDSGERTGAKLTYLTAAAVPFSD
jgi:hypothetical protein